MAKDLPLTGFAGCLSAATADPNLQQVLDKYVVSALLIVSISRMQRFPKNSHQASSDVAR
jgi:hypothetical protein